MLKFIHHGGNVPDKEKGTTLEIAKKKHAYSNVYFLLLKPLLPLIWVDEHKKYEYQEIKVTVVIKIKFSYEGSCKLLHSDCE